MKTAQVNKLYSKLTPYEQATLCVEALARRDGSTADAIIEQVERKTYVSLHWDFRERSYGLQALIGQYGIEYWKNRTLMLKACEYAEQGNHQAEAAALQFLARCVALESAIIEACKRLKVDVMAIKKMAGCPDNETPEFLTPVDAELVKQYADMFAGALSLND